MTVTQAVRKVHGEIMGWAKMAVAFLLIAWMIAVGLSLFGIMVGGLTRIGWQEAGVFSAGMAYALSKL